jgi:MFS family permease
MADQVALVIRPEHRGKALASVQSAWAVGWGGAVLLATVVFSYVPQDVAWRVLFAVGLLPALLIIYVRRGIPEPRRGEKKTAANESVLDNLAGIFRPNVLRSTMIGGLFGRGQCTSPRTLRL